MLLEKLLRGREPSPFVLIEDSLESPALPLLRDAVANLSTDHCVVVLVAETPPAVLAGKGDPQRTYLFDAYTGHPGWTHGNTAESKNSGASRCELVTCLNEPRRVTDMLIGAVQKRQQPQCKVVIDSLEPFVRNPLGLACLKRLISSVKGAGQVLAVHHGDVSVPVCKLSGGGSWPRDRWSVHSALHYLATTRVEVRHARRLEEVYSTAVVNGSCRTWWPPENAFEYLDVHAAAEPSGVCAVEHSRKSGKVVRELNGFSVTADGTVAFRSEEELLAEVRQSEKKRGRETLDESGDPTANLSFNLALTEDQKEAKAHVALPYLKAQEWGTGPGTIYYAPDAADDFDEDDPDDDLNI